MVSLAKVEKVVKPPQKPVMRRKRRLLDGIMLAKSPIQKQPNMFTIKVATGNGKGSDRVTKTEVRNRKILPTAPPVPTNSICFNIFQIYKIISIQTEVCLILFKLNHSFQAIVQHEGISLLLLYSEDSAIEVIDNKDIFLNKLGENKFIEIFRLEEMGDDTVFDNYQRYDFYQLLWFTKTDGNKIYFLDFEEYILEENQVVLIFPGQIDRLDVEGKEGFLYAIHNDILFNINQHLKSDYLNGYTASTFLKLDNSTVGMLRRLNELILQEYDGDNRLVLMESYMEAFLFHISALFENTDAVDNKSDSLVAELMKQIDRNFITERETDFYAYHFGMTNRTINEACKRGTGKTVKQHIQEKLILEIKKEIRLRRKSLKEIAFDLGFNEPAYFTRFFKLHTGLTPTEFRDN